MKIKSIKKIDKHCKVYDITVKGSHHYLLSNGVITHNSGGGGLKYAASQIVFLSKKQHKEKVDGADERVGTIITAKLDKSRITREGLKVETLLRFDRGLDRYYGLLEIAEDAGVVKKVDKKYEFPNGNKEFEGAIYKNPEKWFTQDVLLAIDAYTQANWVYGNGEIPTTDEEEFTEDVDRTVSS
jgi:hypothetical protein